MLRIPRGQVAGQAYHVLNRGNSGATVSHQDNDYSAFLDLLATPPRGATAGAGVGTSNWLGGGKPNLANLFELNMLFGMPKVIVVP